MPKACVALLLLAMLLYLPGCAPQIKDHAQGDDSVIVFGEVVVYKDLAKLRFGAVVRQEEGWVQHLLAVDGYQWLEEQAALVSSAALSDVQKGLALLDWKLWDDLWQGVDSQRALEVQVFVRYEGQDSPVHTLALADDALYIGDLIFLGCPYFDAVALSADTPVLCNLCPIFPLEQAALSKRFVRTNNASGYKINAQRMFPVGTRVELIIKLP